MGRITISKNFWAILFFAALIALFTPDVFWGGKILITRMSDSHLSDYSFSVLSKTLWQQGIFPLWNPLVFCGTPLGADSYPNWGLLPLLNLCLKDVDLDLAWNLTIFFKVFLAGFFTFLYMCQLGLHPAAGLLAGAIIAFAPAGGAYSNSIDSWIFCLPFALWCAEKYFAKKKARFLCFLFLDFCLLFLKAMPQHSLYMGIFFASYVLLRFRSWLGIWVVIFSAGAVSFHLARLLELLKLSPRGHLWLINVLLPTHLITFIFPFIFEAPFRPETNFFFSKILSLVCMKLFRAENVNFLAAPYFGIAGLTFALFARKGRGPVGFYLGAVGLVLFYLMTVPIFAPVYKRIPILSQLFRLDRLNVVFTFALAVLAGIGFDRCLLQKICLKWIAFFYAGISFLVVGTLSLLRYLVFAHEGQGRQILTQYIQKNIYGSSRFRAPLDFYLKRVDEFFLFVRQWTDLSSPAVVLPLIFILATLFLVFSWKHGRIRRGFFVGGCLGLIFIDLFVFAELSERTKGTNHGELVSGSGLIRYLQADAKKDLFRVAPILEESGYGGARERDIFAPQLNMIYGLSSPEGYNPLFPKAYSLFVKNFQTEYEIDPGMILIGPERSFDYALTDFLNVKYFVVKKGQSLERRMPVAYEDDRNILYRNPTCFPRAFLIRDYVVSRDSEETLSILKKRKADLRTFAVLDEAPPFPLDVSSEAGERDAVTVETYSPDHVRIRVEAARDGVLILTDNYFPGWVAETDSETVKILKADFSFRGVPVAKGSHVIDFFYRPDSFRRGIALSLLSVLAGACFLVWWMAFRKIRF